MKTVILLTRFAGTAAIYPTRRPERSPGKAQSAGQTRRTNRNRLSPVGTACFCWRSRRELSGPGRSHLLRDMRYKFSGMPSAHTKGKRCMRLQRISSCGVCAPPGPPPDRRKPPSAGSTAGESCCLRSGEPLPRAARWAVPQARWPEPSLSGWEPKASPHPL